LQCLVPHNADVSAFQGICNVAIVRDNIIQAAALLGVALIFYVVWPDRTGTEAERQALHEGRVIITYWDRHSGHEHTERVKLIQEFNRSQNKVYVRAVPIGYNALMEKTLTSIAGGAPPDILSMDGGIMAQLAAHGLFLPLDDFVASVPALDATLFFPYVWDMVSFRGRVWAIPTTTDTYCLVWNKAAFREAGLDPDRPPGNWAEFMDYIARLTVRDSRGAIERMGFLPWIPWDQSFMWGVLFGGEWYNETTGRSEAGSDPHIIASFRWQQSFTIAPGATEQSPHAMRPERIESFSRGIGDYMSANNPFYSGRVAMISEGEWQVAFIPKYAPGLDWGVAPLPQPPGVEPLAFGPTIVADVIPATARNPEAAKMFLRWFYSPRGNGASSPAADYNEAIRNIPPRINEACEPRFIEHPRFSVFVRQLLERRVVSYPTTPVTQYLTDQIVRQRERVTFRLATPEEAAQLVEENVNRALARARALMERRRP